MRLVAVPEVRLVEAPEVWLAEALEVRLAEAPEVQLVGHPGNGATAAGWVVFLEGPECLFLPTLEVPVL